LLAAAADAIARRRYLGRRRLRIGIGRRLSSAPARFASRKMCSEHLRASALSMLSNGVELRKVQSSIGVSRTQLRLWEQHYADSGSVWSTTTLASTTVS